jgi:magnesium transporter
MSAAAESPSKTQILTAVFDGRKQTCRSVEPDEAAAILNDGKVLTWTHVVAGDKEEARAFLQDMLGFHELAVEDSLSDQERPSLHEQDDHLFLAIAAIVEVPEHRCEKYVEVGFFLRSKTIVTVVQEPLPLIDQWFETWRDKPTRVGTSAVDIMHSIMDAIIDSYFPALDSIEDEVEDLSENVLHGDRAQIRPIMRLKRRLLELRRQITPSRDVINSLLRRDVLHVSDDMRPYFQDLYDHTLRIVELVELNRDTLASVVDIHLSAVSNSLAEVMKKMTIISTILMTAALVAGIYGMNFKHMPELGWLFGYPFALALMLASAGLILYLFRRNKWL